MVTAHASSDAATAAYKPTHKIRFVTAASLFDGHDAAINIMRRILQATGAEVIHLGHNRSVEDVVYAAIQEDAHAVAISSYQGGHMEYFRYLRAELVTAGAGHIKIFGGGGGTIIPEEKRALESEGITRIYHPEDGRRLGLQGMINEMISLADHCLADIEPLSGPLEVLGPDDWRTIARAITLAEAVIEGEVPAPRWDEVAKGLEGPGSGATCPVIGITGTGGAGKSSLTDELIRRFTEDFVDARVAVLSVDPTKRRTGGALLGDRIRLNSIACGRVFARSLATRGSGSELSAALEEAMRICRRSGFDLIIAETSGIGQADAAIVGMVDVPIYVMTPEFGAQTQLEKIDMLDLAHMVVINKYDKPGAVDALRDVKKAYQRAQGSFATDVDTMPVFAAISSQWNDPGTNKVYNHLMAILSERHGVEAIGRFSAARAEGLPSKHPIISPKRTRYLSDIADVVRTYKQNATGQAGIADDLWAMKRTIALLEGEDVAHITPAPLVIEGGEAVDRTLGALKETFNTRHETLEEGNISLLDSWDAVVTRYGDIQQTYTVRGREIDAENHTESLSRQKIPRVALPSHRTWGGILQWQLMENLPGFFPYTAGVFPFKRRGEDPARMFAGEGGPKRTNTRFHYLSKHASAKRLSTAFDSVTLYGEDPDRRPDIWGKVGNSGVSIATVEDVEALYAGFDLTDPSTSVSMTINGPAPAILAFYFNAASRQTLRKALKAQGKIELSDAQCLEPDGGGYSFAELRAMVDDDAWWEIVRQTTSRCRGTVQADILKEDQAQNTCIFSTEFALKMQADMQAWFIETSVKNFYSISISGYHIAEAGANPITQLAFTLANGFTFVEYFLSRGMAIDDFAPNLSFFFSNGMDPEYAVIGRVARRIWAIAMRDRYGAIERSQKLKYHIQTSGRSLHAQEVEFNDVRTTLQALLAIYDNCNSLHTNAFDEAVTTPTEASVRRALAIQLIINREFGVAKNENPNQGAYILETLTELVEEAVLSEFERLNERGGVLGAMERMYQRSKIQEESLYYEELKHTGELPLVGVNTFQSSTAQSEETTLELVRSTDEEKESQLSRLLNFKERHAEKQEAAALKLKRRVMAGDNIFAALIECSETMTLGEITRTLYEVGGQYRRNM